MAPLATRDRPAIIVRTGLAANRAASGICEAEHVKAQCVKVLDMGRQRGVQLATVLCLAVFLPGGCSGGAVAPATPSGGVTATSAAAPEEFAFREVSDLSVLSSYRARYTYEWQGVQAGSENSGSWDVVDEFVKQPPGRHLLWLNTRQGRNSAVEFIQAGSHSYVDTGSGWVTWTNQELDLLSENPFLGDPMDAVSPNLGQLMETGVTANGILADRYAFAEDDVGADLGLGVISAASGDVWVAQELGVVVKYRLRYEGRHLAVGGSDEGVLQMAFDLLEANRPIGIQPPVTAQIAQRPDVPVVPGAFEVTAVRNFLRYKVTVGGSQVAAFYDEEMPAQGWTRREGGVPGLMLFDKDGRSLQVMIQAGKDVTSVAILISER